jgi:hypothetical protein
MNLSERDARGPEEHECPAKPWGAKRWSPPEAFERISAISASDPPIKVGGGTPATAGSLRGVSAVSASDTPIAAELTSRRGGSRLALFVRLASPRRVLDDRVVFADSGSSAGHGDAPRRGSAAHVSHIGRMVKYFLNKLSAGVFAHHAAQKLDSACHSPFISETMRSSHAASLPRLFAR